MQSCSWNREGSLYTNIVWQIGKGGKCKFDLRGVERFCVVPMIAHVGCSTENEPPTRFRSPGAAHGKR